MLPKKENKKIVICNIILQMMSFWICSGFVDTMCEKKTLNFAELNIYNNKKYICVGMKHTQSIHVIYVILYLNQVMLSENMKNVGHCGVY